MHRGVFNAPCRPRGRVQSEAFPDPLRAEVRHTAAGKKGGCDFPWLTQNPPLALDIGGSVTWCFLTSTAVARPRRQRQNSPSEAPTHDVDQATAGERP